MARIKGISVPFKFTRRGYPAPGNCRWATRLEQANNRRSNKKLTHDELTMNMSQWAEELNISRHTLYQRLRNGWSVRDALSTSKNGRRLRQD